MGIANLFNCTRCPRLCDSRRAIVTGAGPWGDIIIVGQNPGRKEELEGEPLIGWSGQRLAYLASLAGLVTLGDESNMTRAEINAGRDAALKLLRRENVVMCRPPKKPDGSGDATPTAGEIKNCAPYLIETLAEHPPQVVVTLGSPAMRWFYKENAITAAHGIPRRWTHPNGATMIHVPMLHPAAATPNRAPWLAEVMEVDWWYLGEVLAARGRESWDEFRRRAEACVGNKVVSH